MKPVNDSLPPLSADNLKKIKAKLVGRREALKQELKTKHQAVYKWLVERNIDLDNLQKYSKNIAAVLTLTNQLILGNPALTPTPTPTQEKTDEEKDKDALEVSELSDSEKVERVWQKYGDVIEKVAQKYDLDPQLIFATIMTESEGNPKAYRFEPHLNDASFGLGQILYTTALSLGFTGTPEEMYRPEINIDLIGKFHQNTIETYGELSPERMTIVYNTGILFGYPTPGHLTRFKDWYYNYKREEEKLT